MTERARSTEVLWRKSSYSGAGQCVEVAAPGAMLVTVRDSKNPDGPRLAFTAGAWSAFVTSTRGGDFERG
ncbi:DUF397 domain-containing protein [Allostreptomyces psammosilenae]|uniref:DUF397 domain-containing protein n=1 Tax=Allostreptomyces psammosilenae TaxID=1892865 RepID=A0A853A0U3_9ACTN|nr:DUF397 domain-containing protein [Allostreptomyces psammosilenae]NYI07757.1 hypothetical protein [Allostreptomyces psammosilenae]